LSSTRTITACSVDIHEERDVVRSCDLEPSTAAGVLQDGPDCFEAGLLDGTRSETRGQFSGWITAIDGDGLAVTAAIRHFWPMYPKSLEANSSCLRVGLLPDRSKNYDSFPPGRQIRTSYELVEGESRTHEFLLYFHQLDTESNDEAIVVNQFQDPLYCLAPWSWYTTGGALGDLCCRDCERFPEYERGIDESLASLLTRRREERLYGDRNYGDDYYRVLGAWNNGEYDYPHVG